MAGEFQTPGIVYVTIEAPDWALDGGFPEDLPLTGKDELPNDATVVEPLVCDAVSGDVCTMYQSETSLFKVLYSNVKE